MDLHPDLCDRPRTLFEQIASFENLYEAAREARRGKRFRDGVGQFHQHLGRNLVQLHQELMDGSYAPGPYRSFWIQDPTRRLISAAPYRDRVVHHALCRLTQPILEKSFIHDSYANREGKGTHRAMDRCTEYARRFRYVLQCDIRLFFPSIDHEILLARLEKKIKDPRTMHLIGRILANSNPQPATDFYFPGDNLFTPFERRKGLPIGNLTSQLWANAYLDPIDHFFRDDRAAPGYIRYVDDLLVFSNDKAWLHGMKVEAGERLAQLRLCLHPRKCRVYPVSEGIPFLGFRIFASHRLLLPAGVARARDRMARLALEHERGEVSIERIRLSVGAWIAHVSHGATKGLRRKVLGAVKFRAGNHGVGAGRVLEQQPEQRCVRQP